MKALKVSLGLIVSVGFILLIAYLFVGTEPFWKILDKKFVREYNSQLLEVNTITQSHNELSQKVTALKDPASANAFFKDYSEKTTDWSSALNDFKLFIESNDKRIRRVGINPDYVRDNIKNTLATINTNKELYQKEIEKLTEQSKQTKQLEMQPAKDAIEALKKLEARFLVGISYRDYAPALGETVHQVRAFLERPTKEERRELAVAVEKVLLDYSMVKNVWDMEISRNARNIVVDKGKKNPDFLEKILSVHPEVQNVMFISSTDSFELSLGIKPSTSYLYPYADIRSVILTKASEELRKAENLLSQLY